MNNENQNEELSALEAAAENAEETAESVDEAAESVEETAETAGKKKKKKEMTEEELQELAERKAERKEERKANFKGSFTNKTFKNGSFSVLYILFAFAALILVNLLVRTIPTRYTAIDVSGTLIYSIGDETEEVVDALEQDVTLKVLASEDDVDERINTFLEKYAALSNHITVEYIDPVTNPNILTTYEVGSSCIVVECEATGKNQIVYFSDIIVEELDTYSYYYYGETNYTETEFDGESQITNAIVAVSNPTYHKIYTTEGHDETALATTITEQLDKLSVTTESVNLSTAGAIPEDCEVLVMNAPTYDITADEYTMISDYLAAGGQFVLVAGYHQQFIYSNLNKLCQYYGISMEEGLLCDNYYAYSYQNQAIPYDMYFRVNGSSDTVSSLTSDYVFVEQPVPLTIVSDIRSSVTVSSLLSGSQSGYIYTDEESYTNPTYGTYYMGLEATETVENVTSKLTVYASASMFGEDLVSAFGNNIVNADMMVDSITSSFDDVVNLGIESKSLEVSYNTFSLTSWQSIVEAIYSGLYTAILPIVLFIVGLVVWLRRRRK